MKIAVTGGNGFIGAATIKAALAAGHDAWSFDRSDGNDILGDLRGLKGAEAVVHLAGVLGTAELFDDVEQAIQVNVLGSHRIMDWCLRNNARYVGILMPDAFPSIYTATKIASQRLGSALHRFRSLDVVHVRAFNVYGPGQKHGPGHPQKIIPTFATNAWRREPLPIWGSGTQHVDLIHVDDVGRLLAEACGLRFTITDAIIDAGSGVAMSVYDVARYVCDYTGWTWKPADDDSRFLYKTPERADMRMVFLPMRDGEKPTKLRAEGEGWEMLDWRPRHDLSLLRDTVDSYK